MNQVASYWKWISISLISLIIGWSISQYSHQKSEPKNNFQNETNTERKQENNERGNNISQKDNYTQKKQQKNNENNYSGTENISDEARETLQYILENHKAKEGYVGGRIFENRENQLPMNNDNGEKIAYQEWDVYPKIKGKNRGTYRLVTGSDGRNWYTTDHYKTFTQIK